MQKELHDLVNQQIQHEFFSAYLYLDIANYYADKNLPGFSHWFEMQAKEEQDHAMLFIQYLRDNGERVVLAEISAPSIDCKTIKEPLEKAYDHEKFITAAIHTIYEKAMAAKDFRLMEYLIWFIREQSEEEKSVKDILDKLCLLGENNAALYMIDTELKARVYTPATMTAPQ